MKTQKRYLLIAGIFLLVLGALFGAGALMSGTRAYAAIDTALPRQIIQGAPLPPLPAATCTFTNTVRTCELWATTGSVTMPTGEVIPVWGFTDVATGSAQIPGPVIVANQGETLELILHNELVSETVALHFPGQIGQALDVTGTVAGGSTVYTLGLTDPGTFIYEAGLTPNGARQIGMGLYGTMIVRPAAVNQAYADPTTAFDREVLLVLSEVDPAFSNDPNSLGVYRADAFSPEYWLINGQPYPATGVIEAAAGETILIRYLNAGQQFHSIGMLGMDQKIIGRNGVPLANPISMVAESIGPGVSLDVLVTVPANALAGHQYGLYDASLIQHNSSQRLAPLPNGPLAFGGMLTFIDVTTGTLAAPAGPVAANITITPNPTTGDLGATVAAVLDETNQGGQNVVAAEYFTNTLGAPGTGVPVSVASGVTVNVTFDLSAATLAAWPSASHIIYLRGQDSDGNWGPVGAVVLNLDKLGPTTYGTVITPLLSRGDRALAISATGDDHESGYGIVTAGRYQIDAAGTFYPLTPNHSDTLVALSGVISQEVMITLPEGLHTVDLSSQDSLGNWGPVAATTIFVDKTGPASQVTLVSPAVLDLDNAIDVPAVRFEGVVTDTLSNGVQSKLVNAEGFIGAAGLPGSGFAMFPADGLYDEVSEKVYFNIPLPNFYVLERGVYTLTLRGKDAAGNWGPVSTGTIEILKSPADTAGPVITGQAVNPRITYGAATVTLTATSTDVDLMSTINAAEWFISPDPGYGRGIPMQAADGAFDSPTESLTAQINVSTWANKVYTIWVRSRDAAGLWGPAKSAALMVWGNNAVLVMNENFEDGNLDQLYQLVGSIGTSSVADIDPTSEGLGLAATMEGNVPAFLRHRMMTGESSYAASFYYDPNSSVMGSMEHEIFVGLNGIYGVFGIEAQASVTTPGSYELRAWVQTDAGAVFTPWTTVSDDTHQLAIGWRRVGSDTFTFSIDGVVVGTVESLGESAVLINEIWLGPSANLNDELSGDEYFDGFIAQRDMQVFLPMLFQK